jgi:hypothetical protein
MGLKTRNPWGPILPPALLCVDSSNSLYAGSAETWAAGESACRPGSVHPPKRADGHPSRTAVAGSLLRSTREHRAGRPQPLARARAANGTSPS